jgi:hypothetical protein
MKFNTRRTLLSGLSLAALMCAGSVLAQETARPMPRDMSPNCNCSSPVAINIVKNSGATAGLQSDFPSNFKVNQMTYNDPSINKHFGDTIKWTLPTSACETTTKVSWVVKNISGDGLQNNDTTGLWQNGSAIMSTKIGLLAKGANKPFSVTLTPAQAKAGRISLAAQDDTAVTEFKVQITGCCITPN